MNKRHSFIYRRNPGKCLECMTDQSTYIFKFREIFHFVSVENVTLVEPKKLFFFKSETELTVSVLTTRSKTHKRLKDKLV